VIIWSLATVKGNLNHWYLSIYSPYLRIVFELIAIM